MSKAFIVVGASSGIGHALTEQLIDEGHTVHGLCRSVVDIPKVDFHMVDVLSNDFPTIDEPIDGLVYLPGTINLKPFANLSDEDFRKDWELNVLGGAHAFKQYLPNFKDSGSVVMISTVAVGQGMPFHASTASAKAGVEGLVRSLAAEYAPKLRVNAVAPSLTETPLASPLLNTDAKKEAAAKRHPLHKTGKPEEIAKAIHFLLSDESSWVTGQVLHVDGGLSRLKLF